jgi:hypothetical protein
MGNKFIVFREETHQLKELQFALNKIICENYIKYQRLYNFLNKINNFLIKNNTNILLDQYKMRGWFSGITTRSHRVNHHFEIMVSKVEGSNLLK